MEAEVAREEVRGQWRAYRQKIADRLRERNIDPTDILPEVDGAGGGAGKGTS